MSNNVRGTIQSLAQEQLEAIQPLIDALPCPMPGFKLAMSRDDELRAQRTGMRRVAIDAMARAGLRSVIMQVWHAAYSDGNLPAQGFLCETIQARPRWEAPNADPEEVGFSDPTFEETERWAATFEDPLRMLRILAGEHDHG